MDSFVFFVDLCRKPSQFCTACNLIYSVYRGWFGKRFTVPCIFVGEFHRHIDRAIKLAVFVESVDGMEASVTVFADTYNICAVGGVIDSLGIGVKFSIFLSNEHG